MVHHYSSIYIYIYRYIDIDGIVQGIARLQIEEAHKFDGIHGKRGPLPWTLAAAIEVSGGVSGSDLVNDSPSMEDCPGFPSLPDIKRHAC